MDYRYRQILLTLLALVILSGCEGRQQSSVIATITTLPIEVVPSIPLPTLVAAAPKADAHTTAAVPTTAASVLSGTVVLPAPLYFLDGERQIGRLEPDGVTYRILTQEPHGVSEFDVSPRDGTVLFAPRQDMMSHHPGKLVRVDSWGGKRTELLTGSISEIRWAPDGRTFAILWEDGPQGSGVYVSTLEGTPAVLVRNQPFNPHTQAVGQVFVPRAWSPDGTRLLLIVVPDRGPDQPSGDVFGVDVVDLTGHLTEVIAPSGEADDCGVPFWSSDSTMLYCASVGADHTMGALWRIPATGGAQEVLVRPEKDTLIAFPAVRQLPDGSIYALVHTTVANGASVMTLQRRNADGSGAHDLRPELLNDIILPMALWANDGSGVVSQAKDEQRLLWIPVDGGPIFSLLEGNVEAMQWGPPTTTLLRDVEGQSH